MCHADRALISHPDTYRSPPILTLDRVVCHHLGRRRVVQHEVRANLAFDREEVIGLFGPNGAGKSTLLDLMAGRIDPTQGSVSVRGQGLHAIRREQRYRLVRHRSQPRLASPQAGRFDPLVLRPSELLRTAREAWLNLRRNAAPAGDPHVHLFDEPPLERPYGELMFERFRRLRAEGALVLFSAHPTEPWHLERIGEVCDRFLFMKDGRVTEMANYAEFRAHAEVIDYLRAFRFAAA